MATVTIIQPTITESQNMKIRCAAYCRVSSSSEDQLNSFMAQTRYYGKIFESSETETLVDVYADEGITGTREDKRDEFQRLMRDCRKGKIDRIYTKSISRFSRNTKDCLKNIRELKSLGITIMFEKENIDTANISDEMMITIMGGLAQEESVSISNNLRWSIQKRMQNGTYILPHVPYGYKMKNQQLVIVEEEAKVVRYIYNCYLNGMGIAAISEILNKQKDKNKWSYATVRYILLNEKYTGNSLWHKYFTTKTLPFRTIPNNGYEEKYYAENTHLPIISQEIYYKVQQLFQLKSFHIKSLAYPLTRKIFCGECGTIFRVKHNNKITYWECRNHNLKASNCSIKQIPEQKIYNSFIALYNKLKINYSTIFSPLLSQLQELKNKKFSDNQQYMEISKEIAKLKEQTHVLARLKTKGFMDETKFLEQTAEINIQIEKLNREQRKIAQSDDEDEVIEQIKEIASIIENGTDLMAEFDEVMFESLVEKIIVKNQTMLEFHLYGGLKFTEKLR